MTNTMLPEETIEGTKLQICVTDTGEFVVSLSGELWKADSLKKLREKVRTHLRQQPVAIPATLIEGDDDDKLTITQITITGQHAGNHNWIYKENKSGDTSQHRWGTIYRGLTGEEIQELYRLWKATKVARETLRKHLEGLELTVHDAYKAARKGKA